MQTWTPPQAESCFEYHWGFMYRNRDQHKLHSTRSGSKKKKFTEYVKKIQNANRCFVEKAKSHDAEEANGHRCPQSQCLMKTQRSSSPPENLGSLHVRVSNSWKNHPKLESNLHIFISFYTHNVCSNVLNVYDHRSIPTSNNHQPPISSRQPRL